MKVVSGMLLLWNVKKNKSESIQLVELTKTI